MNNAATLREQIRIGLSAQTSEALTPHMRSQSDQMACGIAAIDDLLKGGLPIGAITELVGPECSGRTTIALAYVASVTQNGRLCAWIDVADAFDPEFGAASGIDLERLLWVRCGPSGDARSETVAESHELIDLTTSVGSPPRHIGGGSPHPRSEGRDMPQAIGALLHTHIDENSQQNRREKKTIGTPGMPNRPLPHRASEREEQINSDRLPPRRGDNLAVKPRCAESQFQRIPNNFQNKFGFASNSAASGPRKTTSIRKKPWQALDQALRASDLLLQSGGFSVIVLDLASTLPEFAWRIPLATWFRFRAACERTRSSLVLLTQHSCARSSAELVVRLQSGVFEVQSKVMTGIRYQAATERSRVSETKACIVSIRKPPQAIQAGQWNCEAAWARSK